MYFFHDVEHTSKNPFSVFSSSTYKSKNEEAVLNSITKYLIDQNRTNLIYF